MKLTVLVDNNTLIDQYYCGEPAVCYYIEDNGVKLLLDVGYSDVFIKNAEALHIDLNAVSTIAISHGHDDHTRGLKYLCEKVDLSNTRIVAHPDAFKEKTFENESIGSPFTAKQLEKLCKLTLSKTPLKISDNITFLGEIPTLNDFEKRQPIGVLKDCGSESVDLLMDDTALVYKSNNGIFIITGCSHSGICNIIEYAKQVTKEERIIGVIGGFHLFDISPQLISTIKYFEGNQIKELYPCHCVSFKAKAEINKHISIHEVGVGLRIEI